MNWVLKMDEKRDIFDRIMQLPLLRLLYPFYKRYREGLLYLFFGALTTAVSWGSFYLFCYPFGWNEHIANLLSWVAAVLFAFFTNRTWVFAAKGNVLREILLFFAARLTTLGLEEVFLLIFTTLLGKEAMPVKIVGNLLVLILNYVFSKLVVFRKR